MLQSKMGVSLNHGFWCIHGSLVADQLDPAHLGRFFATSLVGCSWRDGPFFFRTVGCSSASHHQQHTSYQLKVMVWAEQCVLNFWTARLPFRKQVWNWTESGIFLPSQSDFQSHPSEFPQPIFENENDMSPKIHQCSSIFKPMEAIGVILTGGATYDAQDTAYARRGLPHTLSRNGLIWCAQQIAIQVHQIWADNDQIWYEYVGCWNYISTPWGR